MNTTEMQNYWIKDLIRREISHLTIKAEKTGADYEYRERINNWIAFWRETLENLPQENKLGA